MLAKSLTGTSRVCTGRVLNTSGGCQAKTFRLLEAAAPWSGQRAKPDTVHTSGAAVTQLTPAPSSRVLTTPVL